jgi:hypothetical protein
MVDPIRFETTGLVHNRQAGSDMPSRSHALFPNLFPRRVAAG